MKKNITIKKAQLFKDEDVDALMNKMRIGFSTDFISRTTPSFFLNLMDSSHLARH